MSPLSLLRRPALWTGLLAVVAYWDDRALHGSFVYDDAGSLKSNPVVTGQVAWTQAATRDFWGTPMVEPQSHKSFRPLTTLSFRLNWILSERYFGNKATDENHTYGFHLVNVGLHGIVTALVTESAGWVFLCGGTTAPLLTGLLFALHPVHAEAVSNITSRGELLMSLFYLLAFLSFVNYLPTPNKPEQPTWKVVSFVYVIPWLCMTLSLFCKEQGATALITLVMYDFVQHHSSVRHYLLVQLLPKERDKAVAFLRRTVILAVETLLVVALRYWLNGESSPDFIYDQNPAAFSQDRFTRVFSTSWIYCLYLWDALYPRYLCPDWSGRSIELIQNKSDPRILCVLAVWGVFAACVVSLVVGLPTSAKHQRIRRVVLQAVFPFFFSPFLLSSNLLVVIGLMKADRVIYLPLMGFCLLEALLFECIFVVASDNKDTDKKTTVVKTTSRSWSCLPGTRITWWGYLLVLTQLCLFAAKVHERNVAWSHSLNLWMSAYQINPRSYHTQYNCGYELSLRRRYDEAEQVLRTLADPRVDGPGNTFVYAMVLFNLNRCDEALALIEEAMNEIQVRRQAGGLRNSEDKLRRYESNLLVARAYCTKDPVRFKSWTHACNALNQSLICCLFFLQMLAGKIMYDAVQADTTNRYAIDQAQEMLKRVEANKELMERRRAMGMI